MYDNRLYLIANRKSNELIVQVYSEVFSTDPSTVIANNIPQHLYFLSSHAPITRPKIICYNCSLNQSVFNPALSTPIW
jgi:hypothetical protein